MVNSVVNVVFGYNEQVVWVEIFNLNIDQYFYKYYKDVMMKNVVILVICFGLILFILLGFIIFVYFQSEEKLDDIEVVDVVG